LGGAITVGDNLSVELRISGVADLYGWEVDIRFDPALLSLSSQSAGNFFDTGGPSLFVPGVLDGGTGVISFVAGSLFGGVAGVDNDGVLARFSFNTSASGPATFSLSNATLIDSQLSSISGVTLRGLTVDIQQPVGGGQPVSLPGTLALALPPLVWLVRSRRVAAVSG